MNIRILIFSIFMILLLVGCQGESGIPDSGTPFIGGNNGLLIAFADGAPPPEVYDGGDFPFGIDVILKNDGEYSIPTTRTLVEISGVYSDDFGSINLNYTVDEELIKTTKDPDGNIMKGTEYHAEFNDLEYIGNLSGNEVFTLRADVCYEYETTATTKICIREDLLDTIEESVCTVTEPKAIYNSGAPVQITKFEESATGKNTIAMSFNIEKKGNGNIYKSYYLPDGPIEMCENERKWKDRVYVTVDAGHVDLNDQMKCQGLKDGPSGK
jgi:hypothetical protein